MNIVCHGCKKEVPRNLGFFVCDYEYCSMKCLKTFKEKHQSIENEPKNELRTSGAFTFSTGRGTF